MKRKHEKVFSTARHIYQDPHYDAGMSPEAMKIRFMRFRGMTCGLRFANEMLSAMTFGKKGRGR